MINTMHGNQAKAKLRSGESLRCCTLGIPHPAMVEILSYAGFECVELDREHSAIGIEAMEELLLACRAVSITPFWRCGRPDETELRQALDMGYTSFVVPHIHNAAEVQQVLRSVWYAPRGTRGVGPGRPIRFGLDDPVEYVQRANDDVLIAFMIEEPEAVESIDEIVAVDGVELVQIGFWDLSVAYGLPIQERHPRLVEAAERVLEAAKKRGVWVGIPPTSPADMAHWEEKGARFFEIGSAAGLLASAARECVLKYTTCLVGDRV